MKLQVIGPNLLRCIRTYVRRDLPETRSDGQGGVVCGAFSSAVGDEDRARDVRGEWGGEHQAEPGDVLGGAEASERDRPCDGGQAIGASVVVERILGLRSGHRPMQFTLPVGAHSTARVAVRFARPAFAAPYAAVPGEGLFPRRSRC